MQAVKRLIGCLFILPIAFSQSLGQDAHKEIKAKFATTAPQIDGVFDDEVWQNAEVASGFYQLFPNNGEPAAEDTEVKFAYNDDAFFVAAKVLDSSPDSIITTLGSRDNMGNADYFGIYIDAYNDGQTAYGFFVTAGGIQLDMRALANGNEDDSWNAVWKSKIEFFEYGYNIEMEIPYSALRFPKTEVQTWGINMFRRIRKRNMHTAWNYVDMEVQGFINQNGTLKGIQNIEPPLRLALMPYVSAYAENNSGTNSYQYKAGLDLKYGINENVTLDMMLIPDFGQVRSDDEQVNFTPYELYYDEQRQFFTEGAELFSKANIFYSRRIGTTPAAYDDVADELGDNEKVIKNPSETQLINATKVTGKFSNGLALGFLNGVTAPSYAEIKDTLTQNIRRYKTQSWTNYNVSVGDYAINKTSNVSLINTNLYRPQDGYSANVTGTEFKIADTNNTYALEGSGSYSRIADHSEISDGYSTYLEVGKISGKWRYNLWNYIESDNYDRNDMGYLQSNNEISSGATLRYQKVKPHFIFNREYFASGYRHSMLYSPRTFTSSTIWFDHTANFKNNWYTDIFFEISPGNQYDYFEPRTDGYYFTIPQQKNASFYLSSNANKPFQFEAVYALGGNNLENNHYHYFEVETVYRVSDRLQLELDCEYTLSVDDMGWVSTEDDGASVIFGARHVRIVENKLEASYSINNKAYISFRGRHYWTRTAYSKFYNLQQDGSLVPNSTYSENEDNNFNAFSIDMAFNWEFAPGSFFSIVYKNNISHVNEHLKYNYLRNLESTLQADQLNNISFKILYYLDYQNIHKWLHKG